MNNRIDKIKYLNKISKDDKSDTPNPFRTNYDYGEGGYNFLDKIKELNKRRKKKDKKKKDKKKSRSSQIELLLKESARKKSEYPQEFRLWVRNQILDGKLGPSYQKALREFGGQKMHRVNAWLKGSFPPPRGAAPLDIIALKKEWETPQAAAEPQRGDGRVDISPGEVRDLADAMENSQLSGRQMDLFQ